MHLGLKRYKCMYCEKEFYNSYNYKKHVRTHTGERPYKCYFCDKTFQHAQRRKLHLAVHGMRPYKCLHCKASYRRRKELHVHWKNVHGIVAKVRKIPKNKVECDFCNKLLSSSKTLKNHIKTCHTVRKPYTCKLCGKVLPSKYTFKSH